MFVVVVVIVVMLLLLLVVVVVVLLVVVGQLSVCITQYLAVDLTIVLCYDLWGSRNSL